MAWRALRSTPNVAHPLRQDLRFGTEVLRNRQAVRLILGYTFHSWELMGMWAWAPAFVAAAPAVTGTASLRAVDLAAYVSASFHAVGFFASISMGRLSERYAQRLTIRGPA